MEFTAQIIADFLKGEIIGNPDECVNTICRIEEGSKGGLAFLSNPKYEKYLYTTQASIVLVNKDLELSEAVSCTLIRVADAYQSFASLLNLYQSQLPQKKGVAANSTVETSAKVGEGCYIGAYAYIGENAVIGNNVV